MKQYIHTELFELESKDKIENLKIAYSTYGDLNEKKDNVIWVFHAISADSDVLSWWKGLFGNSCIYDPRKYFIICANTLGSPFGSTSPENTDFPVFTVRDVVQAHLILADFLGISKIHTAIGGSFGGYQAVEFAYSFKGVINHLILLAASAKESAWGIAIHESQRIALSSDQTFGTLNGGYSGMMAARSIAMLTYRTNQVYEANQSDVDHRFDDFKASSYIQYHGRKFAKSFNALSYYYLTKCIDSHNIGRGRGGEILALNSLKMPTLIIGFASDVLVPVRFQKFLAENIPNAIYQEIQSDFGHDGFLIETEKISQKIEHFYNGNKKFLEQEKRVVLKFGGTSLYGSRNLENFIEIIKSESQKNPMVLVVSARGVTTNLLMDLYDKAKKGIDFETDLQHFISYQKVDLGSINTDLEIQELRTLLSAVRLIKGDVKNACDRILAIGELISAKCITSHLVSHGFKANFVDARNLIYTRTKLGKVEINMNKSKMATELEIARYSSNVIPVITGFIAQDELGATTTLGRNGSNYSATLIANFIEAKAVQNWTDVSGVYSANPSLVHNAIKLDRMSYKEANELANFGVNLLHAKTIFPLIQSKIPLQIRNTSVPKEEGTIIDSKGGRKGIKAVTSIDDVALVIIEGNSLSEKVGIDARIFNALSQGNISVRMISQASTERGIGFVIDTKDVRKAETLLTAEFEKELNLYEISSIRFNKNVGIIAILGRHNYALEKAIQALRRNSIWMHLISNSISGEHISLVVDKKKLESAVRLVHNEVFGVLKTINVFAFGKGQVGSELINQILHTPLELVKKRRLAIKIIGVADSNSYFINSEGISSDWKDKLLASTRKSSISAIIHDLKKLGLDNIVIVDNTSSEDVTNAYLDLFNSNFDIVASNKKANSSPLKQYEQMKKVIASKKRHFYYEANVGAGLPVIDLLKNLYHSSDTITKIRGVFSGSLSYIFNNYSLEDESFSTQVRKAMNLGYTEPDPREDLNGLDVARKLVILAREINCITDVDAVSIQNLIPENLRDLVSIESFLLKEDELNLVYDSIKQNLKSNEVLRYVAELDVENQRLEVSLQKIDSETPLGQVKNADSLFEIYTESYGTQPIVIQGAGAGPRVTARAVYSDLLRLGNQL